eukprot:scaffold9960_cov20-Tisochrysis_lutea.AAC.1
MQPSLHNPSPAAAPALPPRLLPQPPHSLLPQPLKRSAVLLLRGRAACLAFCSRLTWMTVAVRVGAPALQQQREALMQESRAAAAAAAA